MNEKQKNTQAEANIRNDLSWWASFPELNPNIVMETTGSGELLYANSAAKKIIEDLKTQGKERELFRGIKSIKEILTGGQKEFINELKLNSEYFQLLYSMVPDGNIRIYGVDITERKNKEERVNKLNRILRAISDSNHIAIRATAESTEQEYFEKTCKIIIDDCGYSFVWIRLAESDEEKSVKPVACAGFDKEYYIDKGYIKEEALKRDYASSLVLPLMVGKVPAFGAINIYSSEPDGFMEEEINLLSELADDLAYEISTLRSYKELQISENKFKSIFNFSPIGVLLMDVEGNVLDCNEMLVEMYGIGDKKELVGKNGFDYVSERYQESVRAKWTELLKKGFINDLELEINQKSGQKVNCLISATVLLNIEKKPYTILGMIQDITRIKTAEESLILVKQEWEKTFDNMPDLVSVIDNRHRIIRVNRAMTERLGTTLDECMGLNCFKCMHNLNAPPQFCPHTFTLKDGKPHTVEIYEKNLNGNFLITTTPLFGKNGEITGSVHVARDITKIKKSSEKLKRTSQKLKVERVKYAALLSSIGHGVAAVDKNGKIMFVNKKVNTFLNKSYKSLMGKKLVDVLDLYDKRGIKLDKLTGPLSSSLNGQTIISRDYYCIDRNKKKINLDLATAPIFLQNKIIGAIGVYEDITKQKEIERAKTEFVSLASHQLRTPITEIGLSAEMLSSGMAGELAKSQKKYLKNISDGVKEITGLIETLLNISRMQMGTFIVDPKPVNLPILIDKLIDGFSMQIKKKKLLLKKYYDNNLPKINLDTQIMHLILENLFSNAIKYTEEGSVGINIKKEKKYITIEVSDTGCGIPDRQKHLVFTKLFRADNLLKNKTKGHGLGLYIVKVLTENAGGKISFESKEGKGTTFYVRFPLSGMKKKIQQSLI